MKVDGSHIIQKTQEHTCTNEYKMFLQLQVSVMNTQYQTPQLQTPFLIIHHYYPSKSGHTHVHSKDYSNIHSSWSIPSVYELFMSAQTLISLCWITKSLEYHIDHLCFLIVDFSLPLCYDSCLSLDLSFCLIFWANLLTLIYPSKQRWVVVPQYIAKLRLTLIFDQVEM